MPQEWKPQMKLKDRSKYLGRRHEQWLSALSNESRLNASVAASRRKWADNVPQ